MKMTTFWENERRKLLGQPLIADDDTQANTAIDAPQAAVLQQAEDFLPKKGGIVDIYYDLVELIWNANKTRITDYVFKQKNLKRLNLAKEDFFKYCKPVLEVMHLTAMGRADIEYLYSIPTETVIELYTTENDYKLANDNLTPEEFSGIIAANSHVTHSEPAPLKKGGHYYEVLISPFLWKFAEYKQRHSFDEPTTFEEWLGATMTVEVGHLMPEQIALEYDATRKNPNWLKQPNSAEFKKVYTTLANRNAKWRYDYRKTFNIQITQSIFDMLDKYELEYDAESKILKTEVPD